MAGLLVAIGVLGILMSVALPSWRVLAKREKEAELLFRGGQYVRAIDLYQRRFPGAYPADLEALVEGRFLRRLYLDPMTGEPFRILTQGSAATALGEASASAGFGGRAAGDDPDARTGGGRFSERLGRASGSTDRDFGRASSGATDRGFGRASSGSIGRGVGGRRLGDGRFSRTAGGTDDELGGIVGVVSRSSEASLREYNGAARYDRWLFVHARTAAAPGAAGMPGAGGGDGSQGGVRRTPRSTRSPGDGTGADRRRRPMRGR